MTYEEHWHRLQALYEAGEAKAIVRWVLDVRFRLSMADIISGKVTQLSADDQTELEKIMCRLEKGEPVQYVLGMAFFRGRPFHVAPGVLIPRPETEELCEWIITDEKGINDILDIGTGSGCIAITLSKELQDARVSAWDISEEALTIAKKNAKTLDTPVIFEQEDILHPKSHQNMWDVMVSNPPYIQPQESGGMEKNVLDYEPHIALFAPDGNPILFYEAIIVFATRQLKTGGRLYFELNPLTAETVAEKANQLGFTDTEIRRDQYGKPRFLRTKKR